MNISQTKEKAGLSRVAEIATQIPGAILLSPAFLMIGVMALPSVTASVTKKAARNLRAGIESTFSHDFIDSAGKHRTAKIGEMVEGEGIYLGQWKPEDKYAEQARYVGGRAPWKLGELRDRSCGQEFALFAAPENLTDDTGQTLRDTFENVTNRLSRLQNWHGHEGSTLRIDEDVYRAIRDGAEKELEDWFIPPRDVAEMLLRYKNIGELKGTLIDKEKNERTMWTNSELTVEVEMLSGWATKAKKEAVGLDFESAARGTYHENNKIHKYSTRPVRAVLQPA